MSIPSVEELQSELLMYKVAEARARAAQIAAEPKPTPSPRRRHFKSINQIPLPPGERTGDLGYVLTAICEEGRAWRKYQGERWTEIESLPDI
jgi:hypothetical protein